MIVDFDFKDNFRGVPSNIFRSTGAKLGRHTYIYGRNGSGKTTISEALREYGVKLNDSLGVTFRTIEAGRVTSRKWPAGECPFQFHVFNRFYVEENLSPFIRGESSAKGLVYIGSDSVDANEKIESLSDRLAKLERVKGRLAGLEASALKSQESALREAQTEIIGALAGSNPGKYTTQSFNIGQVKRILQKSPAALSEADYARQLAAAKVSSSSKISPLPTSILEEKYLPESANRNILMPIPNRVAVPEIQADNAAEAWVEEGMALHTVGEGCKFCTEGVYSSTRSEQLKKHFSDDFHMLREGAREGAVAVGNHINTLKAIEAAIGELRNITLLGRGEGWSTAIDVAVEEVSSAIHASEAGLSIFEQKVEAPSNSLRWDQINSEVQVDVSRLNEFIDVHNAAVSNAAELKAHGEAAIESHYVANVQARHARFGRKIARIEGFVEVIDESIDQCNLRRGELRAEMENTEELARRIDSDVRYVFGHHKLEIVTADSGKGYRVLREGSPASNLSEGEGNAIAYAYFINSLRADGVDLSNSIVVIDDPVTSLDKDSLFAGYSLTVDRLLPARQVIVLTHDFDYFRLLLQTGVPERIVEVASSPDEESEKDKTFPRQSVLELLHGTSRAEPRLRRIQTNQGKSLSEYHYLFSLIANAIVESDDAEDLRLYGNAGRRLLEGFIAFRAPQRTDFQARVNFVAENCARAITPELSGRIVRFLHAGSHRTDPSPDSSLDVASIIEDLSATMEFMAMADPVHFSGMCRSVKIREDQLVDSVALGGR